MQYMYIELKPKKYIYNYLFTSLIICYFHCKPCICMIQYKYIKYTRSSTKLFTLPFIKCFKYKYMNVYNYCIYINHNLISRR